MNRDDFEILGSNIIYFDNGATTLKPRVLSEAVSDYYNYYSSNAHRGDYGLSIKASGEYEKAREKVSNLIGAKPSEIAFTSGCTDSLNKIIFGFFRKYLKNGDEILLTKSEHASNLLPWFELCDEVGCTVKYIDLDSDYKVTAENVIKAITSNTKVISLAHVTNVVGDVRPIKEICKIAHENGVLVVCDGAQSVPHMKIDVNDLDVDFLAFSAHKMCGPTGVGVLYVNEKYNIRPIIFGGGMNSYFDNEGNREYKEMPDMLEAGTPNIAGVVGFGYVIDYLNKIGFDKISAREKELRDYFISKVSMIPEVEVYNKNSESGIVTFNYKNIFPQDLAIYLDKYNICVRAGSHCAKILKDEMHVKNTCRASFYFYNTKEEIDVLIDALSNKNIINELI